MVADAVPLASNRLIGPNPELGGGGMEAKPHTMGSWLAGRLLHVGCQMPGSADVILCCSRPDSNVQPENTAFSVGVGEVSQAGPLSGWPSLRLTLSQAPELRCCLCHITHLSYLR